MLLATRRMSEILNKPCVEKEGRDFGLSSPPPPTSPFLTAIQTV